MFDASNSTTNPFVTIFGPPAVAIILLLS